MKSWPSTTGVLKSFGFMDPLEIYGTPGAKKRGEMVHAACHLIAADKSLGDGWEARHPECHPYLDAYRRFRREHRIELVECEREYRSKIYRFVSHPDQIVMLDGKGPVVLELKSGLMPKWCQLQTAGQILAMGKPAMRRFGLQLKADGRPRLFPHEDFRDLDRFRAMIVTYWTVQEFRIPLEGFLDGISGTGND